MGLLGRSADKKWHTINKLTVEFRACSLDVILNLLS